MNGINCKSNSILKESIPVSPVRVSEIQQELSYLGNVIEDTFRYIYELNEMISDALVPPFPQENMAKDCGESSPNSNIGNSIRDKTYKIESVNKELKSIIERLAI